MFYIKHPKKRSAINLDNYSNGETLGKWVVFGERAYVGKLWKETKELVQSGEFYEAKFMRTKDNAPNKRWALLVYADNDNKDKFYDRLMGLDSHLNLSWVSNDSTRKRRRTKRKFKQLLDLLSFDIFKI